MVSAPFIGVMVERHPLRRSWLVLGVVGANVRRVDRGAGLAGHRTAVAARRCSSLSLALGGPGSMIAFDFARTFNPPNRLGTATGIVNVGGFVASLITMLLVGIVLDIRGADATHGYQLDDFRIALSAQYSDLGRRRRSAS